MPDLPAYEIYTDGACTGNPGPGGWAAVLTGAAGGSWRAGHEERTTNNRMEIKAAIKGLEQTLAGSQVTVYSDSQYLVNTMTRGWQRKMNLDLWAQLDGLVGERHVSWRWVPGHAGYPLNEEANRLAQAAADPGAPHDQSGVLEGGPGAPAVSLPSETPHLSHLDEQGRARMVDVSAKEETRREAVAKGAVFMRSETLALLQSGGIAKGDVLTVAQVAGVMAAKRTSELIPMCHPLRLSHIQVELQPDPALSCVEITATVRTTDRTGVEMEALTAVSVAALTIYDMCKAVDRAMRISDVRLTRKSGGKSGDFRQG
ncbi:MAG: cyclic pyranopterin monophosphate synthase MoaC [Chloroflexi bacterium]|nr:cyclic pyranopterin monophosphate synthase MoaC [Chloroflexota bacterium]